jgi:hypothetical protein
VTKQRRVQRQTQANIPRAYRLDTMTGREAPPMSPSTSSSISSSDDISSMGIVNDGGGRSGGGRGGNSAAADNSFGSTYVSLLDEDKQETKDENSTDLYGGRRPAFKSKTWLWLLIVGGLLAAVGVVVFFFVPRSVVGGASGALVDEDDAHVHRALCDVQSKSYNQSHNQHATFTQQSITQVNVRIFQFELHNTTRSVMLNINEEFQVSNANYISFTLESVELLVTFITDYELEGAPRPRPRRVAPPPPSSGRALLLRGGVDGDGGDGDGAVAYGSGHTTTGSAPPLMAGTNGRRLLNRAVIRLGTLTEPNSQTFGARTTAAAYEMQKSVTFKMPNDADYNVLARSYCVGKRKKKASGFYYLSLEGIAHISILGVKKEVAIPPPRIPFQFLCNAGDDDQ